MKWSEIGTVVAGAAAIIGIGIWMGELSNRVSTIEDDNSPDETLKMLGEARGIKTDMEDMLGEAQKLQGANAQAEKNLEKAMLEVASLRGEFESKLKTTTDLVEIVSGAKQASQHLVDRAEQIRDEIIVELTQFRDSQDISHKIVPDLKRYPFDFRDRKENTTIRLAEEDVCFFTGIGGALNGWGEHVELIKRNKVWHLRGKSVAQGGSHVRGEVTCVTYRIMPDR